MNNTTMTLGSLFDGSGGFPLGGLLAGVTPVWSSEIEPFPVRVTTKRFPDMKHYGDISTLKGAELPPVDIITFGSPCQDMSAAGKRSGLDGSRSSLFYEAVRIIKEMRGATDGKYPRYIVWENVPGAFSSNRGQDFKAVLEEICKIKDAALSVPFPGKWETAGRIVGDGFSVAWRQLDAQFWGVPQRRKRIYLVADFAGWGAGKVLFESEGLSGYSAESFRAWQGAACNSEESFGETGCYSVDGYNSAMDEVEATLGVNCGVSTGRNGVMVLNDQGGNRMDVTEDMTCTLRAEAHHPPVVVDEPFAAGFCTEHSAKARGIGYQEEASPTLRAGTVPAAIALEHHPTDSRIKIEEADAIQTLTSRMGTGGNNVPLVMTPNGPISPKTLKIRSGCPGGGKGALVQDNLSATLGCNNDQTLFQPVESFDCRNYSVNEELSGTLQAKGNGGHSLNYINPVVYGICSKDSNGMKSPNPHSGFYEATTARTLDANGGNPGCNQGGMAVVEGNGSRPSHKGDGYKVSEIMYTLNATEQHAVAYGVDRSAFNQGQNAKFGFAVEEELEPTMVAKGPGAVCSPRYSSSKASFFTEASEERANTLVATDYKDPPIVNDADAADYIVRRLTPTECARLQGFPDWWCDGLATAEPTSEDMAFWTDVFETHRKIMGTSSKPKTDNQIRKWLQDPSSDSAEYKMWGNGVALPCVYFVLSGIVWNTQNDG